MAIKTKTFIHAGSKLLGADGSADGVLPEDVQDWIDSVDASPGKISISCCPYGNGQIFTFVCIDTTS
tara:strand:+ start:765 stop:965 length:201 start_codon:yes stop_codon:yes gene_type:complete